MGDLTRLERADRPALAVRRSAGTRPDGAPTLLFLPGYASDMAGSKATALFDHAVGSGRACVLFDYAGCGASDGAFADQTLADWLDDAAAVAATIAEPLLLVGSSMGGWLALLLAERLGDRLAAFVGIAAAPDFTDWGFSDAEKAELAAGRDLRRPNPYGPEPTLTTAALWRSGAALRCLDGTIAIDAPVRLLHGQADPDVPWRLALDIAAAVRSADVQTLFLKDGDHRLSRPGDIALLLRTVDALC